MSERVFLCSPADELERFMAILAEGAVLQPEHLPPLSEGLLNDLRSYLLMVQGPATVHRRPRDKPRIRILESTAQPKLSFLSKDLGFSVL